MTKNLFYFYELRRKSMNHLRSLKVGCGMMCIGHWMIPVIRTGYFPFLRDGKMYRAEWYSEDMGGVLSVYIQCIKSFINIFW